MKINKLLFFLLALVSLSSCVEYVDGGVPGAGPEPPEVRVLQAAHSNPTEAKYVGDEFKFMAYLNAVDVTASTKFRVNGTNIPGSSYRPVKTGSHSVIATMDNLTATFKFNVEEKDEQQPPVHTGNRIENKTNAYQLDKTIWVLNGKQDQATGNVSIPTLKMPDGVTPALNWVMVNFNGTDLNTATNVYYVDILVPLNGTSIIFPFQAAQIAPQGAQIIIQGSPFTAKTLSLSFEATGNSAPSQTAPGNANYTGVAKDDSNDEAKLFWNGEYSLSIQELKKGAKGLSLNNIKSNATAVDITNLKIVRK